MVTAQSLRHLVLLATKQDIKEPSTKRGKTHLSPDSSGHWLGQGQNWPKLTERKNWESHFPLPYKTALEFHQRSPALQMKQGTYVHDGPAPSRAKDPPWESSGPFPAHMLPW